MELLSGRPVVRRVGVTGSEAERRRSLQRRSTSESAMEGCAAALLGTSLEACLRLSLVNEY